MHVGDFVFNEYAISAEKRNLIMEEKKTEVELGRLQQGLGGL